MYKLADYF